MLPKQHNLCVEEKQRNTPAPVNSEREFQITKQTSRKGTAEQNHHANGRKRTVLGAPPGSLPHPGSAQTGRTRPRGDATGAMSLFLEGTVCPESLALLPVICLNSRRRWKDWAISYSLQLPDSGQVASVTTKNTSPQPCVSGRRTLSQVGPPGSSFEGSAHRAPPSRP